MLHEGGGENWFGCSGLKPLPGISEDIFLVALVGQTRGHTGLAVRTDSGWLLHCGDAYFHHGLFEDTPQLPAGIALFERLVQTDPRARRWNHERLRELNRRHSNEVTLFCAHDPVEFERLTR